MAWAWLGMEGTYLTNTGKIWKTPGSQHPPSSQGVAVTASALSTVGDSHAIIAHISLWALRANNGIVWDSAPPLALFGTLITYLGCKALVTPALKHIPGAWSDKRLRKWR